MSQISGANSWMPHEVRWGALVRHDDSLALTLDSVQAVGALSTAESPAEKSLATRSRLGTFINREKYQVFGDEDVVAALKSEPNQGHTKLQSGGPGEAAMRVHPAELRSRFVQERTYPGIDARSGRHVAGQETIGPDAVWWRVLLECQHVFEQARNACFHSVSGAFGESSLCLVCDDEQRITAAVPLFGVLGD